MSSVSNFWYIIIYWFLVTIHSMYIHTVYVYVICSRMIIIIGKKYFFSLYLSILYVSFSLFFFYYFHFANFKMAITHTWAACTCTKYRHGFMSFGPLLPRQLATARLPHGRKYRVSEYHRGHSSVKASVCLETIKIRRNQRINLSMDFLRITTDTFFFSLSCVYDLIWC